MTYKPEIPALRPGVRLKFKFLNLTAAVTQVDGDVLTYDDGDTDSCTAAEAQIKAGNIEVLPPEGRDPWSDPQPGDVFRSVLMTYVVTRREGTSVLVSGSGPGAYTDCRLSAAGAFGPHQRYLGTHEAPEPRSMATDPRVGDKFHAPANPLVREVLAVTPGSVVTQCEDSESRWVRSYWAQQFTGGYFLAGEPEPKRDMAKNPKVGDEILSWDTIWEVTYITERGGVVLEDGGGREYLRSAKVWADRFETGCFKPLVWAEDKERDPFKDPRPGDVFRGNRTGKRYEVTRVEGGKAFSENMDPGSWISIPISSIFTLESKA